MPFKPRRNPYIHGAGYRSVEDLAVQNQRFGSQNVTRLFNERGTRNLDLVRGRRSTREQQQRQQRRQNSNSGTGSTPTRRDYHYEYIHLVPRCTALLRDGGHDRDDNCPVCVVRPARPDGASRRRRDSGQLLEDFYRIAETAVDPAGIALPEDMFGVHREREQGGGGEPCQCVNCVLRRCEEVTRDDRGGRNGGRRRDGRGQEDWDDERVIPQIGDEGGSDDGSYVRERGLPRWATYG